MKNRKGRRKKEERERAREYERENVHELQHVIEVRASYYRDISYLRDRLNVARNKLKDIAHKHDRSISFVARYCHICSALNYDGQKNKLYNTLLLQDNAEAAFRFSKFDEVSSQ